MTITPEILNQLSQIAHSVTLDKDGHILSVVFNPPHKPQAPVKTQRYTTKTVSSRTIHKSVTR